MLKMEKKYNAAYTELYELLKNIDKDEISKIPKEEIKNIEDKRDLNHIFRVDKTKLLKEQDVMPETKALFIALYKKYVSPDSEKEAWEKYDKFCLNKIEEEKRQNYDPDVFKKSKIEEKEEVKQDLPIEREERKSFFRKIFEKIKNIFK